VDAATVDRVKVLADQAEASASQAKIEELEAKLQAAEAKEAAANSEKARKEAEAEIAKLKTQIAETKKHAEEAAASAVVAEGHKSKAEEHKDAAGVHAAEAKLARDEAHAALLFVNAAKAETKGYQDRAVLAEAQAKTAAAAAKLDREQTALAAVTAGEARDQANAAVAAARAQVELAVAEVGRAQGEVNRSRDEANRAHDAFLEAQKEVGKARAFAKAAARWAGLAETAAGEAATSADQARQDAAGIAAALQEAREALPRIQEARVAAVAEIDGKIQGLQGLVVDANAHNDAAVAALRDLAGIQQRMAALSKQALEAAEAAQVASANAAAETVGQVRLALQGEVDGIRNDLARFQDLADVAERKLTRLGERADAAEQRLAAEIQRFDRAAAAALLQVAQVEQKAREVQAQIDDAKNTALQEVGQVKNAAVAVVDGAKARGLNELEAKKQGILLDLAQQAQLARQRLDVSILETEARLWAEIQQKVAAEQAVIAATVGVEKARAEGQEREAEKKIQELRERIDRYQQATAETEQKMAVIRQQIADAVREQKGQLEGLRKDIAAMDPHVFLLREWGNLTEDPKKQVYPYKDSVKNQKARDVGQLKMEVRNPLPKEIQDGVGVGEGWIPGEKFQEVVFGIHQIVEGATHPKVLAADGSYFLLYEKDQQLWIERRDSLFSRLEEPVKLGDTLIQGNHGVQWVFQKGNSRIYIGKIIADQKVETYILETKRPLNGNVPTLIVTPLAQGEDRLLDMVTPPAGAFLSAKGLFKARDGSLKMTALAGKGKGIADPKLEPLANAVGRDKATLGDEACLIFKKDQTRLLTYTTQRGKGTVKEVTNVVAPDSETQSQLLAMWCVKSEENPSTLVSIRTENGFYVIWTQNENSLLDGSAIWKILARVKDEAVPVLGFMSNINDIQGGRGKPGEQSHRFGVYFVPGKEEFFTFELAQENGKAWGKKRKLNDAVPEVSQFPQNMAVHTNLGHADPLQKATHDMQFVESPDFKPNVGVVVWEKGQNIYMQLLLLQNREKHHDVVFDLVGKPDGASLWKLYNPYPFPVFIRPVAK